MNVFERYLSAWVALCMVLGVLIGKFVPRLVGALRDMEFGTGSHINIPIAILIWLMIYPMMLRIDFGSIVGVGRKPKGLVITLVVNWLVKPFSMAFLGWLFFKHLFLAAHRAGARKPVHRRGHHPRCSPLHGDGVRLVVPGEG
jgi:ACR3 family arsenite transporter